MGEKINNAGQREVGAYSTPQPTCFNYIAQHIALFLSIQHFLPMFVSFNNNEHDALADGNGNERARSLARDSIKLLHIMLLNE